MAAWHHMGWGTLLYSFSTSLSSPVIGGWRLEEGFGIWLLVGWSWLRLNTLGLVFWSDLVFAFRSWMMMMIPTESVGHLFR